jgi:hypothetical protein
VHEGDLVSVPLQLISSGDVGGLTFLINYNPDYLSDPQIAWDASLDNGLKQVSTPYLGQVRGVFVLPGSAVAAGTQSLAMVQFRARTTPAEAITSIDLQLLDISSATGDPLVYGTDLRSATARILSSGTATGTGDNNANGRLDIGDASLLLRLLAQVDPTRPADLSRNDFNHNGVLDTGDAVKILRIVAGIDSAPASAVASLKPSKALNISFSALPSAEVAILNPEHLRGTPGQLVTVQVRLQNLQTLLSGATFSLDYPVQALRLRNSQSLRLGGAVPPNSLALWNVGPAQNNFSTQNGHVTLALSSSLPWSSSSNSLIAELTFEVQSGATSQLLWPITLQGAEITSDGYNTHAIGVQSMSFSARDALPAALTGVNRDNTGHFAFNITGDSGANYIIEASEDLVNWSLVQNVSNAAASFRFTDPNVSPAAHRFYRVRPAQ